MLPFAEESGLSTGGTVGWVVAVGALVTAAAMAWDRIGGRNQKTRDATVRNLERTCDRLQKTIDVDQGHIRELAVAVEQMHEEGRECEARNHIYYGNLQRFGDWARVLIVGARKAGVECIDPPEMPPAPPPRNRDAKGFRIHTLRQNTTLAEEVNEGGKHATAGGE